MTYFWWGCIVLSLLWRCWLAGRKGIRPVKTEWWGAGIAICLERGADLRMAQLMPLPPTVSCFSKIQIGFTFLVPAHLGSPGKRSVKRVCVVLCPVGCCIQGQVSPSVMPVVCASPLVHTSAVYMICGLWPVGVITCSQSGIQLLLVRADWFIDTKLSSQSTWKCCTFWPLLLHYRDR